MKSLCRVSLLVVAAVVVVVNGQIPIPRREVGYVYGWGQANASIHLDFYIDLICPDSKAALPTVRKVADYYGPQVLELTSHLFPLPYHRNGFYAAKGAHVISKLSGNSGNNNKVYDWFDVLYNNIDSLTNSATHQLSDADIVECLAKLASQVVSVTVEEFKEMVDSDTVEMDTRTAWKYACTRGVAATPTFMVNDITVAAETTWTVEDWRKVIDPLLSPQPLEDHALYFKKTCPDDTKHCEYLPGKVECCTKGENCIPNVGCRC